MDQNFGTHFFLFLRIGFQNFEDEANDVNVNYVSNTSVF